MLCLHPFLYIAIILRGTIKLVLIISGKIIFKMMQKCYFFLQFTFSRIISHSIRTYCICLFTSFLLNILKVLSFKIWYDFCWIIEIHTCWSIRKQIAQTIFGWIVHPFLYMNLNCILWYYMIRINTFRN